MKRIEPDVDAATMLRLIKTIKYLVGIAERGEGRKIADDETPEQFVLGYVKRLEQTNDRYERIRQSLAMGPMPMVRFDLSPAQTEGVIREHLIRLGWTPPSEQHDKALLRQALEALEFFRDTAICEADTAVATEAIVALRERLGEGAEP